MALLVTGLLNKQIAAELGTEFKVKSSGGTKDAGRIVGRVGPDGRKVGHSSSKGLADLHQRVIADPMNSGVSFFGDFR